MPNITCPYCGSAAHFAHPSQGLTGRFAGVTDKRFIGLSGCPSCESVVAIAYQARGSDVALSFLPTATVAEPDDLIPAAVRDDLYEARKCRTVQAYKAVAMMCRRSLQGACLDKGASPKKRLADQVDELIANAKVHSSLKDWADAIRLIGNTGAHPSDDGLEAVTQDEADDLLEFTEQFLYLTYVVTEQARRRVAAKRGTA